MQHPPPLLHRHRKLLFFPLAVDATSPGYLQARELPNADTRFLFPLVFAGHICLKMSFDHLFSPPPLSTAFHVQYTRPTSRDPDHAQFHLPALATIWGGAMGRHLPAALEASFLCEPCRGTCCHPSHPRESLRLRSQLLLKPCVRSPNKAPLLHLSLVRLDVSLKVGAKNDHRELRSPILDEQAAFADIRRAVRRIGFLLPTCSSACSPKGLRG